MSDLLKGRTPDPSLAWTQPENQVGITRGGFAREPDKTAWYLKRHNDPMHAYSEHLTNRIYRQLGHGAPHSEILADPNDANRPVYASKIIEGFSTLKDKDWKHAKNPRFSAARFIQGAPIDVMLNNTDLHNQNVGMVNRHHPVRIDNGAGLTHTAWGNRRSKHEGFNPSNLAWQDSYRTAGEILMPGRSDRTREQALVHPALYHNEFKKLAALKQRYGGWDKFVARHAGTAPKSYQDDAARTLDTSSKNFEDFVTNLRNKTPSSNAQIWNPEPTNHGQNRGTKLQGRTTGGKKEREPDEIDRWLAGLTRR